MVSFRPRNGVVGPLPNGRTLWLINGGDPITTDKSWDDPPSTPGTPKYKYGKISFINRWFFRVWGMFQGSVGIFPPSNSSFKNHHLIFNSPTFEGFDGELRLTGGGKGGG